MTIKDLGTRKHLCFRTVKTTTETKVVADSGYKFQYIGRTWYLCRSYMKGHKYAMIDEETGMDGISYHIRPKNKQQFIDMLNDIEFEKALNKAVEYFETNCSTIYNEYTERLYNFKCEYLAERGNNGNNNGERQTGCESR